MFDRFAIAPLLVPIAVEFRVPLSAVAVVATAYFFLYGAMQPFYGILSDRLGRVRVMRATLLGVAVAGTCSALAPSLGALLASRAATGALVCAIVPTSLVYVGDRFPFAVRQQAIADLLAAVAVGTAGGTLGAGLLAHFLSWRLAFLLPALVALALAWAMRWLPESLGTPGVGPLEQLGRVLKRPWALFLIGLALVEGSSMLGFLTFLPAALEAHGVNAAAAGLVVASYGVSVLGCTQVVKRVAGRVPATLLIVAGGTMLTACYVAAALSQSVPAILAASLLAGGGYGVMHSTFQTWATDVAPEARGTATALFATGAFIGAGLGTGAVAGIAGAHDFGRLFLVAAGVTVPVVVAGAVARWRYPGSAEAGPPFAAG
jgi:predicted MFS family arabinose efflux permease